MPLESDDREELLERRLTDKVTDSVERSLKARYSWVLIISSVLFGGLIYGIVDNIARDIVAPSKETLDRAKIQLDNAEKSLARLDELADTSRKNLDQLNEKIKAAVADLEAKTLDLEKRQLEVRTDLAQKSDDLRALQGTVTDFTQLVRQVKELSQTVSQLVDKGPATAATPATRESLTAQQRLLGEISQRAEYTVEKLTTPKTIVFYQFSGAVSREAAKQIADELRIRGYSVPGEERKASTAREVRYYYPEDRAVAVKLANDTTEVLRAKGFPSLTVVPQDYTAWTQPKPPTGTVELWLDLPKPAQ